MRSLLLLLAVVCSYTLSAQYRHIHLQEDFNDTIMPAGWSTNAVTGAAAWSIGVDGSVTNGGSNNLDGTPMAYFDDDAFGATQTNNTAQLITSVFDNSSYPTTRFSFDYNFRQFNGPLDSFKVEVFDGSAWATVFSQINNDCGNWLGACAGNFPKASIDITNYSNANCQVRFTYFDGNDWCWYVGIDNVVIDSEIPLDIGVVELNSPVTSCALTSNEQVQISIANYGTDTIRNFSVRCDINNGQVALLDTVNTVLFPSETMVYSFKTTVDFSNTGIYSFDVLTILIGDSILFNDSLSVQIQSDSVYAIPRFENFEMQNGWSTNGVNSSWQLGVPQGVQIDSAFSDSLAFVTNLGGSHNNNELSYLYSPCYDLSLISGVPSLTFKMNYDLEINGDNLIMESSTDAGMTWNKVNSEFGSLNWYALNGVWEGNSAGWIEVKNSLPSLQGNQIVKFRFKFESNGSVVTEGVGIDDFSLSSSDSVGISMISVVSPSALTANRCGFGNENIVVSIANEGPNTIDSIFLFYRVNGAQTILDTVVTNLQYYDTSIYIIGPTYDFSAYTNYNLDVWAKVKGDLFANNDSIINLLIQNITPLNVGSNTQFDNFDSFIDGSCVNAPTANQGDSLMNGWQEQSPGEFAWHVQNGSVCRGTPTFNTGPSVDHTTGVGNFLFTESSIFNNTIITSALLESPCVDFTGINSAGMKFWYHRYGSGVGNLYIDIFANGVWNLGIDSLIGENQTSSADPWKKKEVIFNQFSNRVLNVRFRVVHRGSPLGDIAIDDVEFFSPPEYDAELVNVDVKQSVCEQDSAKLLLNITNRGVHSIAINQLKIKYQINNGTVIEDSNSVVILVDSSLSFVVDIANIFGFANQQIKAWVELPNDSTNNNDTLIYTIDLPIRSPQYTEGFENIVTLQGQCANYNASLNLAWEIDLNDQWVAGHDTLCNYGTSGATPIALTGPDSAYAGNGFMYFEPAYNSVLDTASLISTCIDLRNDSISYLDFYYHMFGAGTGKLYVDAIVNGVSTRLDSIVGQQHFSATDPWSLKTINLNQFAGNIIRIRFTAFESSSSVSDQGAISIDNVRISNSFPVSINETTNANSFQLFPNPTNGEFTLRGTDYTSSELVLYVLDMNGRVIESRTVNPNSNSINERFDLSNQANGVYFISIRSEGNVEVKKVVLSGQ